MTIRYKLFDNYKIIKLFGEEFVKNNKERCKMIINNKEEEICEYLDIKIYKNILEIKLKEIKSIDNMSYMFFDCNSLESLPYISKYNTNNVTNMSYMSSDCNSLESFPDISKWNTNNVTNMNDMFSICNSLESLPDISKWNTNNVTNMSYMFSGCISLKIESIPNFYRNF